MRVDARARGRRAAVLESRSRSLTRHRRHHRCRARARRRLHGLGRDVIEFVRRYSAASAPRGDRRLLNLRWTERRTAPEKTASARCSHARVERQQPAGRIVLGRRAPCSPASNQWSSIGSADVALAHNTDGRARLVTDPTSFPIAVACEEAPARTLLRDVAEHRRRRRRGRRLSSRGATA